MRYRYTGNPSKPACVDRDSHFTVRLLLLHCGTGKCGDSFISSLRAATWRRGARGRPSQGGSITTASGLVFIGAADDNHFRAFDAKTGKELWSTKLNASAESVPATYLDKDGGQYVVVSGTGGGDAGAPVTADEITAFRLSKGK